MLMCIWTTPVTTSPHHFHSFLLLLIILCPVPSWAWKIPALSIPLCHYVNNINGVVSLNLFITSPGRIAKRWCVTWELRKRSPILSLLSPNWFQFKILVGSGPLVLVWSHPSTSHIHVYMNYSRHYFPPSFSLVSLTFNYNFSRSRASVENNRTIGSFMSLCQ